MKLRDRRVVLRRFLPTARKIQVARSFEYLKLDQTLSVLAVGAGDDPYRHHFPNAQRYVTIDIDQGNSRIDVVASASNLPFPEHSFECVIATEVLEYMFYPQTLVQEARRVLRPGGTLILSVPFIFNSHYDYWRPTKFALERLLGDYIELSIRSQGNRLLSIWDLITTSFWPYPILMPLRIFSNFLYILPRKWICENDRSSAPIGFFVTAKKPL